MEAQVAVLIEVGTPSQLGTMDWAIEKGRRRPTPEYVYSPNKT